MNEWVILKILSCRHPCHNLIAVRTGLSWHLVLKGLHCKLGQCRSDSSWQLWQTKLPLLKSRSTTNIIWNHCTAADLWLKKVFVQYAECMLRLKKFHFWTWTWGLAGRMVVMMVTLQYFLNSYAKEPSSGSLWDQVVIHSQHQVFLAQTQCPGHPPPLYWWNGS